jgi:hypothetical protein
VKVLVGLRTKLVRSFFAKVGTNKPFSTPYAEIQGFSQQNFENPIANVKDYRIFREVTFSLVS